MSRPTENANEKNGRTSSFSRSAGETKMGECADWLTPDDARVVENFLKLGCGCTALMRILSLHLDPDSASLLRRPWSWGRLARPRGRFY